MSPNPEMTMLPKVSCVMTTFRRKTCVERSVMMWLKQDYAGPLELIILNTDEEFPIVIEDRAYLDQFSNRNICIVNNNIDQETRQPYTNVGSIRRDAMLLATGEYYICWDDDDVFLQWCVRQCVDGVLRHPQADGWKPRYSLFEITNNPNGIVQAQNTLEASIIVRLATLREIGFNLENGTEHLKWYTTLSHGGRIIEDAYSIPGYSYRWNDPTVAGHKQSGNMGDPNNFENHKRASQDRFNGPLTLTSDSTILLPYMDYFRRYTGPKKETVPQDLLYPPNFSQELIDRYVAQYLA